MERAFRQVDVFGIGPATGNPVAVVLGAEGLADAELGRFSAWTNLSECTYVLAPTSPDADYRVRIFSHTTELPFAGHPTLGTARAWLDAGGAPRASREPGVVVQECGAGLVPVRCDPDGVTLAFAAPPRIRSGPVAPDVVSDVAAILGLDESEILAAEWLDNGPGWVGVLLADAARVAQLVPDVRARPGEWAIGVAALASTSSDGPGIELEVRAFFSVSSGLLFEDPVTGSLNASLAQWLLGSGRLAAPYVAAQGSALGRTGRVRVTQDPSGAVWVGGRTHVVVRGSVDLASYV